MRKLILLLLSVIPFLGFSQRSYDFSRVQKPSGVPTIGVSPSSLPLFTNNTGTASLPQSVSYSGSGLTANVAISFPSGFEGSTNGGGSYTTSFSLTPSGGVVSGTLLVRVASTTAAGSYSGNVAFSSTGATTQNVGVTATVSSGGSPSLSTSPTSLSGFITTTGTQSSNQTFTVSGSNLTANAVVTAPASYLVSSDGTTYTTSVTISPAGGSISSALVYVVISQTASVGSPSGNVTIASTGATTQNVAVSGTVNSNVGAVDTVVGQFFFTATTVTVSSWVNVAGNPDATAVSGTDSRNYQPVTVTFVPAFWTPVSGQHSSVNSGGAASSTTGFPAATVAGYFYNQRGSFPGWNLANDTNVIVSGLNPGALYKYEIMSSRASTNKLMTIFIDDSTNHRIDSAVLDVANNTTTLFTFINKRADANGVIRIGVWPQYGNGTTGNQFGYFNAMRITKQATRLDMSGVMMWMLITGLLGQYIRRRYKSPPLKNHLNE